MFNVYESEKGVELVWGQPRLIEVCQQQSDDPEDIDCYPVKLIEAELTLEEVLAKYPQLFSGE